MPQFAAAISSRIHAVSPYQNFDFASIAKDLRRTFDRAPIQKMFEVLKPRFVVEVGSWKGDSALLWASLMKQHNIDGAVFCIDTWLGGFEHLTGTMGPEWSLQPYYQNGYPTLYYRFLANVMHEGLQDYIVPLATTSAIGARWLAAAGLTPNLVFIDASHEEDDVYQDLQAYWKLLNIGGILCGDDFTQLWYGVICGVNRFAREKEIKPQLLGTHWILQKNISADQQMFLDLLKQTVAAPKT